MIMVTRVELRVQVELSVSGYASLWLEASATLLPKKNTIFHFIHRLKNLLELNVMMLARVHSAGTAALLIVLSMRFLIFP